MASTSRIKSFLVLASLTLMLALTYLILKTSPNELANSTTTRVGASTGNVENSSRNQRDVLLYAYYETDDARTNLEFFVKHALHQKMDFVFIINGETLTVDIPNKSNIRIIRRPNTCFDIGSFGEVLRADDDALIDLYDRFILMNASVRGPFLPGWSRTQGTCWSDIFLSRLSGRTKLTGMSANCDKDYRKHIQSMLMAVDRSGLELILPSLQCAEHLIDAVMDGETALTSLVRGAGFDADPIYSLRYSDRFARPEDYWKSCSHTDIFYGDTYDGMDVHPFDTVFVKTKRTVPGVGAVSPFSEHGQVVLDKLTQWADKSGYSSYDYC